MFLRLLLTAAIMLFPSAVLADTTILGLPVAPAIATGDTLVLVHNGNTYRATYSQMDLNLFGASAIPLVLRSSGSANNNITLDASNNLVFGANGLVKTGGSSYGASALVAGTTTTQGDIISRPTGQTDSQLVLDSSTLTGAVTPKKYIRVGTTSLEFVNNAYSSVVTTMSDTGVWNMPSAILGSPLVPTSGGTGLTTSGASGNSLVSNGTGGWQSVPSTIAPTYGTNGSSYPASHFVAGTCTLSGSSCAVLLSGAAVYTTGSSYACWADPAAIGDSGGLIPSVGNKTGTGFTVFIQGGGSLTGLTAAFGCFGI